MRTTATRRDLALLTAAALALLVGTAALTWSRADDASSWDVPLYQSFGDQMADGEVPYRDFRVEYPPGSLPVFLLPSLAAADGEPVYEPELNDAARGYARGFAALMTALLAATVALTAMSLAALRASVGHAAVALALVGATPLLLGELALTRFDALPVALSAACVAALLHGRSRLAALALGLAVAAKLYPLLLLPLAAIYLHRRLGRREAALFAGITVAVFAAVVLPFVALAPAEAWFSIRAQLTRGVQVESLSGNLVVALSVAADHVGLGTLGVGVDEGGTGEVRSADVTGALGQVAGALGGLAVVVIVLALWVAAWRRPDASGARLVRDCAAVVAAQLALGRVLSPQFVLWLVPLVPLVAGRRGRVATALLALALVATQLWFPDLYRDYVNERGAAETTYLLGRNALLFAVLVVLTAPAVRPFRSPSRPTAAKRMNAGATGTA
ncbi:MAG TPA: glycosyltransferase 87 family protein [Gaiella sp.]|nr:glycosyltransferase 87 family protein [Gaiella sp.]